MILRVLFLYVLLYTCAPVSTQPLTILKKIGKANPNSLSGLGQSFYGVKLKDENLYFEASYDGFVQEVWRTNGTPLGTEKILSESTTGDWSLLEFVQEGIFINAKSDHFLFYDITTEATTDLGIFANETFTASSKMDLNHYIFLSDDDDSMHLYITDMTASGTEFLGTVGAYKSFMLMYACPFGAVVYNTSGFSTFIPKIYVAATHQIQTVQEYLAPYKTVSSVTSAIVYDHYMFLTVNEGGFTKYYTFDFNDHAFYPGNGFFGNIEAFYHHGHELIIVSEREIVTLDTTTLQIHEWTEEVFPLGIHIVRGDSLYYHGYTEGDSVKLHIFDLNTHAIKVLKNSFIGKNHYDGAIELHKGALYYTHDSGPTIFLRKYNYANQNFTDIDSITVRNGGASITNGVVEVNGVL
ncbi:MAG: hypothetical protein WAT91_11410, partial [Saprospiraceae bacterium]